ncbi:MAG: preprotein translocase subunit SecA [Candidatus Melainabacteria bacterium]|nr:preprotein translocase subunit SecA [Candidatus Melainabacteria bacterium]
MSWDEKGREWLKGLFGDTNERRVKSLQPYLERTNNLESQIASLSDDELKGKTAEFKTVIDNALKDVPDLRLIPEDAPKMPGQFRFQKDKVLASVLDKMLPEAFAVCREVGKRTLNMRHFDVQIIGGAALHFNKIAEMRTGEGKTLVATLPVYLNALAGRGVHVVTVNDYLARRDAEWMGTIYRFLGLDVGLIYSHQPDHEKYRAYRADISYGTNHEFGFDYLRDNMRTSIDELVQRPYYFAIVDEVDNILIDEARTPLIISGAPSESYTEVYKRMAQIAPLLERGMDKEDEDCDYWVDEKQRTALITERGVINAEKLLGVNDLFDMHFNFHHHLSQAIKAKELYKRDSEYVVRPNEEGQLEVVIVDEFTGRMMLGRRWSEGLHQAVEAKEQVPIQDETMTYASITYQNLFRLYPKLAGMTGTAMTEAAEFNKIYNLDVVAIPTNKPSIREDHSDIIYKTERQKYYSVVEEIVEMHEIGRPVLVGTVSIEKSELISELLSKPQKMNEYLVRKIGKAAEYIKKHNLTGEALENLKKILERPGQIDQEKLEEAIKQVEASLGKKHDELVERLYSIDVTAKVVAAIKRGIEHSVLNAKHHEREAHIVAQAGRRGGVTVATNMAGRGTDILLGGNPEFLAKEQLAKESIDPESPEYEEKLAELVKKYKKETDAEHDEVVNLGGLHIIGTERHESRRIDNQLRGRAGRQGDPGSARFFLSLEDTLMRIFGGEKIAGLMDLIGADEEMPIEAKMVSNSIQNAQKKVEAHHFDIRKHVLQYDDVLNTQREVIYRERRKILEHADLKENVLDMMEEHIDLVMQAYIDPEDPPEVWEEKGLPEVLAVLENDVPFLNELSVSEFAGLSYEDARGKIFEEMKLAHKAREDQMGVETMRELERHVLLRTIDTKWVDYLHNIDLLRDGVNLRGYGQRDPLQEYKREAFDMFNMLLRSIQQESIQYIFHAQPVTRHQAMSDALPPELAEALAIHGIMLNEDGEIDPEDLEKLLSAAATELDALESGQEEAGGEEGDDEDEEEDDEEDDDDEDGDGPEAGADSGETESDSADSKPDSEDDAGDDHDPLGEVMENLGKVEGVSSEEEKSSVSK